MIFAAILARVRADIEQLQNQIDREGNFPGNKLNPKHAHLETLIRRNIALSRLLAVHAAGAVGRGHDLAARAMKQRQFMKNIESVCEDVDLLAKPWWLEERS